MHKKILIIGIVPIVVGAIFVSVSRQYGRAHSFPSVTGDKTSIWFSRHIEWYLEGNEKYRLNWDGTFKGYEPQNPTLEVKDPDGNTLYSTFSDPPPTPIDFWGNVSGVYTIDFNYLESEDACYNIYRHVGAMEAIHPYHILLSVGLLSVVSGAVFTVASVVMPSRKLKTEVS